MKHSSVRAVLQWQKVNAQGHSPISLCITIDGKRTYSFTGLRVPAKAWDKKKAQVITSYPNSSPINAKIKSLITGMEGELLRSEVQGKKHSHESIKRKITGRDTSTVYDYAVDLISHLERKFAPGTIVIYWNELEHFNDFAPGATFESVDPAFLRRYESYLLDLGISGNSIHKNWKIIKRIFNSAINDGVTTNYPFRKYDNPKYRQTDRTYLTKEEVERVELALKGPLPEGVIRTGYYFLLGAFSGLRYSDWKRFNYEGFVRGGRMILRAKKNGEMVSMPIHSRLARVIEILREIGPVDEDQTCNDHLKALAISAGINKKLTTHCARHSFAIRCAELGISIESTAELMGINIRSCQEYYKVTGRKIDAEMAKWEG